MERQVKLIGFGRWLCIPFAYIMYFGTVNSFGTIVSCALAMIAMVAFWVLMRKEQSRLIGESIAKEIENAISAYGNIESMVEIKRLRSGIIARVYLINAKEKAVLIHRTITRALDDCSFKKYLWIMQLTDMPGKGHFKETQRRLNEQLLDELLKKNKGDK